MVVQNNINFRNAALQYIKGTHSTGYVSVVSHFISPKKLYQILLPILLNLSSN